MRYHTMLIGGWGESEAANYLRKKGYKILAAGYRSRFGEIDIVASFKDTIVFVEVKTRRSDDYARPSEQVTPRKLEKIKRTAELYLAHYKLDCPARIDIIEIIAPKDLKDAPTEINHIESVYTEIKP